jgi:hypothetical protein
MMIGRSLIDYRWFIIDKNKRTVEYIEYCPYCGKDLCEKTHYDEKN